jgi:two-component system cell cycle sensor histidine kinase/response regulator CckA
MASGRTFGPLSRGTSPLSLDGLMAIRTLLPKPPRRRAGARPRTELDWWGIDAERASLLASLEASRRDLEEAQRIARVGSWTLDPATGEATWSKEMHTILGLDPTGPAIALDDIAKVFSAESVAEVGSAVERAVATGAPWQMDLEMVGPKGSRGWVLSNGVVERDSSGKVVKIRGTMQDVSDQRRLEAQLQQAQRLEAVGQLAGGIAHDFNNLLTAIRGFTELVTDRLPDDDPNRPDLQQVIRAADRAAELTAQLLAFSRRQMLRPIVVDPGDLVTEIAPMLRRLLGEHIELVTRASPDAGRIKVDPSQFEQVVVNLAVNARDAMAGGGALTIETTAIELDAVYATDHPEVIAGRYVGLVVSDSGSGMDAATKARIFEPFFTTKEAGRGTGMGLATVYGIVRQSGGSIYVYSEPGEGTSFKVYLPRVDDDVSATNGERSRVAAPTGTEVVLLVEDEPAVREFAARILAGLGYTILEAGGGAEAIALAANQPGAIHLLVTDVTMPGLQGPNLAANLRIDRPDLRVLYVSGFTETAVARLGIGDGAAFLSKPFAGDALARAVRQTLDAQA